MLVVVAGTQVRQCDGLRDRPNRHRRGEPGKGPCGHALEEGALVVRQCVARLADVPAVVVHHLVVGASRGAERAAEVLLPLGFPHLDERASLRAITLRERQADVVANPYRLPELMDVPQQPALLAPGPTEQQRGDKQEGEQRGAVPRPCCAVVTTGRSPPPDRAAAPPRRENHCAYALSIRVLGWRCCSRG